MCKCALADDQRSHCKPTESCKVHIDEKLRNLARAENIYQEVVRQSALVQEIRKSSACDQELDDRLQRLLDKLLADSTDLSWFAVDTPSETVNELTFKARLVMDWLDHDPNDLSSSLALSFCMDFLSLQVKRFRIKKGSELS
jgi:hypothetical protein